MKLYLEDRLSCHHDEFTPILRQRFEVNDAAQMDYLQSDVRTCTFLTRDATGNYKFRHKSFMEFFVATTLAKHIQEDNLEFMGVKKLSLEIGLLITDILSSNPPTDTLTSWLLNSQDEIIRNNALTLLVSLDADLTDVKLDEDPEKNREMLLIARFLQGDEASFSLLYQLYWKDLVVSANNTVNDQQMAEEVAADTLARLWTSRDRYNTFSSPKQFRAYLLQTLKSESLTRMRSINQEIKIIDLDTIDFESIPEPNISLEKISEREANTRQMIMEVIEKLNERDQVVIKGRYMEEKTYSQLADELGLSVSLIRTISSRAMRRMRNYLETQTSDLLELYQE